MHDLEPFSLRRRANDVMDITIKTDVRGVKTAMDATDVTVINAYQYTINIIHHKHHRHLHI